ncbi:MAG: FAD-dependent oxidoreductase [Thermoleophilaceae bacterium]|nr:FAD-dependent oxidoreductase [Thermoleophilaceae bacterium]
MSTTTRIAIVGSGPAGFYAAGQLLGSELAVEVDMFDRLPTPWGLVRLGVAPDHPKIKSVTRIYEKTAALDGFRFFGNVEVGRDIQADELIDMYDAVIYAVGAQTDRRLGIEGEDLKGSWPATSFVAWYNGHPDFQDIPFDLDVERAVVIGNGNVAVDVARMLTLTPDELAPTDTTDAAIEAISNSGLKEIVLVGRRGPVQAAFTTPELKELGELEGADVIVDPADLELDAASEAALAEDNKAQRNMEFLREYAQRTPTGKPRTLRLSFLQSPTKIVGDDHVTAIELVNNKLEAGPDGRISAVATDQTETIECGLVLRSVGYRGVPLNGVPFDEKRATIRNKDGRVLDDEGNQLPGVYCTGWIKRGPSGVIGTNRKCATETVDLLLEDQAAGKLATGGSAPADAIVNLLNERSINYVPYAGWSAIDQQERSAGEAQGRPRVKLETWDKQLTAAATAAPN